MQFSLNCRLFSPLNLTLLLPPSAFYNKYNSLFIARCLEQGCYIKTSRQPSTILVLRGKKWPPCRQNQLQYLIYTCFIARNDRNVISEHSLKLLLNVKKLWRLTFALRISSKEIVHVPMIIISKYLRWKNAGSLAGEIKVLSVRRRNRNGYREERNKE